MGSPLYVSLEQRITDYRRCFIDEKDDLDYTADDMVKAIAFLILASAALEDFVENLCETAARKGIDRFVRGEPTTTGRSLITWYVSRSNPTVIPVRHEDIAAHSHLAPAALQAYESMVRSNHGINSKDFAKLVYPVGLRDHHTPSGLSDRLQSLSDRRDPAVHLARTKKIARLGPSIEFAAVREVLSQMEELDQALNDVVTTFPCVP